MKKLLIVLFTCTAVLLTAYVGYRGYKAWKQRHMMTLAQDFLKKSDGRNALLSISQVLRANPQHLEATRLMAGLMESARSPSALSWRSRVVELNPRSVEDRLALAEAAMRVGEFVVATNALEGVSAEGKKTAAYHNLAGAVSISLGLPASAEAHFMEVAKLEPQNPFPSLNLAVVRLHGTNQSVLQESRATLKYLSFNPTNATLRCQALRELTVDAMRFKQYESALSFSKQLLDETDSKFSDRILRLDVLLGAQSRDLKSSVATYQREATNSLGNIYELANWEMSRLSPTNALVWLRTLPMQIQTNQPVALLEAQCRESSKDWTDLQLTLQKQNWVDLEFIRHAFLSRAFRGLNLSDSAKIEWNQATKDCNGQKQSLIALLRISAQWNWRSEGEEILWTVVSRFPEEKWAAQMLTQALIQGGQTRPLMSLFTQQLKSAPDNLGLKNNLAMVALLLDARELKPHELAREVYDKGGTNASFAATFGFSLYVQGKNQEALKIFEQMQPKELDDPGVAGYYGLVLKATGNRIKAKKYLDAASKAPLLPEERKLMVQATTGI